MEALALLVGPPFGWALAAVWGALWGSFANVAIWRIGKVTVEEEEAWEARAVAVEAGRARAPSFVDEEREHLRWIGRALRSVAQPSRSFCPRCGAAIRARDNLPVVSWLLLGGKCRDCRAPISIRYPLVELLSVGLALAVYARFVAEAPAAPLLEAARFFVYDGFALVLLVLTAIDLDTMLLPDAITWPAIPLFFAAGRLLPDVGLVDAAIGAAVGYGGLRAISLGWRMITGREGMGGGDAKLLALVGGLLGWHALPWTLVGASLVGVAVSLPLLAIGRARASGAASAVTRPSTAAQHDGAAKQHDPGVAQHDATVAVAEEPATDESGDEPITRVAIPFGPYLCAATMAHLFFAPTLRRLLWSLLLPGE